MSRVILARGDQADFLKIVKTKTGLSWDEIAGLCGIGPRSLRDWRREKYKMSLDATRQLAGIAQVEAPRILKILPEHWSAAKAGRMAGLARQAKYGNLGTPEGRKRGGLRTQELRRLFPQEYPSVAKRKQISIPERSPLLAEFIGIVLGDGHISDHQVLVYVNSETDKGYELFIRDTIDKLFQIQPAIMQQPDCKVKVVCASSADLVEFLNSADLERGNKVKKQVCVPKWVSTRPEWELSCLRGLWDTDGCVYQDRHMVKGKEYLNPGMAFSNRSLPLLEFVQRALTDRDFSPRHSSRFRVYLRKGKDIRRYFLEIGTNNPKHWRRFQNFVILSNAKIGPGGVA